MKANAKIVFLIFLAGLTTQRLWSTSPIISDAELIGKQAPELAHGDWINSSPLLLRELRGKVVLLEFWTFGCYNCLNTLPHVREWHRKYSGAGLKVIGIHTPEFDREKDLLAVRREVTQLAVAFPVVTDNDHVTWDRYYQRFWPVLYLIDRRGIIRYIHIGEGDYDATEEQITSLIREE